MRKVIAALALVFLAAHIPFLPPTLEDIDSINFALGVADFDVARHQPHPPGYPVFIALGKTSTALLRAVRVPSPEARGLAIWSAVSGSALIACLFAFFRALGHLAPGWKTRPAENGLAHGWNSPPRSDLVDSAADGRALAATVFAALSPLFWFTALRPLSDATGLAVAAAAQALIMVVIANRGGPRVLTCGAFLAGLAIGVRSQTFLLTLPLLGLALSLPRTGLRPRDRLSAVAASIVGAAVWAVPLVLATGGLAAYAAALGSQAGEDFSGVVMLWNMRTARVALDAVTHAFLWPWGHPVVGGVVIALALAGCVRLAWQMPRTLAVLVLAFTPYTIFHLLFHETVTVRYALPLVAPIAYLAMGAVDAAGRIAVTFAVAAFVTWSLIISIPATIAYGRQGSPAFRALQSVHGGTAGNGVPRIDVLGFHAVARRAVEWQPGAWSGRVLKAPHGREWLTLVQQWRTVPQSSIAFIADPRRTDLALIDPHARRLASHLEWGFTEPPFVGGARPGDSDVYAMNPPGWMLDRGWALTPEVAGITAADRLGPHRQPSVAWVRTRQEDAMLMLGGRHLGAQGDPDVRISLTLNGRPFESFTAGPGFFFKLLPLPAAGAEAGSYVPLEVRSEPLNPGAQGIPVALEQFDLQGPGTEMTGTEQGWHEPEYNPLTARSWQWTSERATLWVRPIGRDVTLTLSGESPLRYFDASPTVTVTAAGRQLARFTPSSDFTQQIVLPADALASADGHVVIESDKSFVPGDRDGTADRRHLALRIYSFSVK